MPTRIAVDRCEASKRFFLKKEAKTFRTGAHAAAPRAFHERSFLVLFFKKELLTSPGIKPFSLEKAPADHAGAFLLCSHPGHRSNSLFWRATLADQTKQSDRLLLS